MSSSDFRQLALKGKTSRPDRLFRAAISAYCSLTRPSRRETAQLEDLAFPLFDDVSVETRRYAAAALCECEHPPAALVRRLCNETIDIAAPLLIRANSLRDIDLIALIGRHGLPHARAIARRQDLNPSIANLIRMMENSTPAQVSQPSSHADGTPNAAPEDNTDPASLPGASADHIRQQLRAMMRQGEVSAYSELSEAALSGSARAFQKTLARRLDVNPSLARSIAEADDHSALLLALRSLELSEEQAFVIVASVSPGKFSQPETIRLMLTRYRAIELAAAQEQLQSWRALKTSPGSSALRAS